MTTQKQTAAAKPELKSHPKTELNFAAGATSELASLMPIPDWAVSAAGDGSISGLRAGHQIEDDSIRRLASYYRTLDAAHQTDFASHVREMQRRMSRMEYALFWNRVVRDVLGG